MPDYSAGTASIRLRPDASDFIRDTRAKLTALRDPGFTVRVEADMAALERETAAFRAQQEARGIELDVDAQTAGASAEMAQWRARQEGNAVRIQVDVDVKQADAQMRTLSRSLGQFSGGGNALKLNLGAVGIGAIQPAITGLAQLAAGLQQVAQAGIAVPGVIAGAAASIGTLVLGLNGVSDAFSAVSDAADTAGTDQAASARAGVAASNSLRNAVVDEAQARKDVTRATRDAQQALTDLRIEQRGGILDESRAILEAQKAREDLVSGKFTDVRDATLRVAEADQRVIEVRNRNLQTASKLNEANEKGIQGSDQVVAANERLIRTQQGVADAQSAVASTAGGMSAAQTKAQKLMDSLSPSGQKLVQTLVDMKPAFRDFRNEVQEPLLEGKADEFQRFYQSLAPNLTAGLGGIATGLNQNITALVNSIDSGEGKGLLDRILGNTGEAQARFSAAIDPLVKGIGVLAAAGTDSLPRLADAFTDVAKRFRDFITEADQDGRLQKWIDEGLDGVSNLGNSVLNIGKSFTAITGAAGGGGNFLEWLSNATGKLQTFLNSAEGQNKLKEYFEQGRDILREFMPLIENLPGALKAVGDGATLYVGGILPLITELASLMREHPELVAGAIAAYLAWNTINPIMKGVNNAIGTVGIGLTNLGTGFADTRKRAKDAMAETTDAFDRAGGPKGVGKFAGALHALSAVGGAMPLVGLAVIPLMAALSDLDEKHRKSAEAAKAFEQAEKDLEDTLDRVTGKVTAATRDQAIAAARSFDQGGIAKGDGVKAAEQLGIPPDVYTDALLGKPDAVNKVRDVLSKNNLIPEFQANPALQASAADLADLTGGKLTQDDLIRALLGDPAAQKKYGDELSSQKVIHAGSAAQLKRISDLQLENIAPRLSQTGQQSLVAGGALGFANATLPGAQADSQLNNQANFGRFRIRTGATDLFPADAQVNATGFLNVPETEFKISAPSSPEIKAKLDAAGIGYVDNPTDNTLTATVPKDSPFIEKYKQGSRGPTPGGRNQGFLAELHGQEWVHDAGTVAKYGPDVMNAMWRGQIDPKALRGLLPGFALGGPTDPNDPNYVGIATGAAGSGPAPGPSTTMAPTLTPMGGGVNGFANSFLSGISGPLGGLTGLLRGGLGGTGAGTGGWGGVPALPGIPGIPGAEATDAMSPATNPLIGVPGLIGLAAAGDDPALKQAWQSQTEQWLGNWASGTLSRAFDTLSGPLLSSVGLENSVLSPNNVWNQSAMAALGHFTALASGQKGTAAGGGTGGGSPAMSINGQPITVTPAMLQSLFGGGGGDLSTALLSGAVPSGGANGLQVNTARGKAIIEQNFPWATNIGGVRADRLKWHPSGLALDVMIPGAGGLNDPTPPAGKKQGDELYAWLKAHQSELGIDYMLWQEKDHFNHIHVNFAPSGFGKAPGFDQGGWAQQPPPPAPGNVAPAPVPPPAAAPAPPAPPMAGMPLPAVDPARGNEYGLQNSTVITERAVQAQFPQLETIGGWAPTRGGFSEHSSGQAADFMIPGQYKDPSGIAMGDQIRSYVLSRAGDLGVDYVIWRQMMYYADGRVEKMPNRGDDTENHLDHVHIHTIGGGKPVAGQQFLQPGKRKGPDAYEQFPQGFAGGGFPWMGPGKVRGPGTSTSDSIPARLSNDEHVTQAKATRYYGHELFDALNARAIPKEMLPGFALGGFPNGLVPLPPPRPILDPTPYQRVEPQKPSAAAPAPRPAAPPTPATPAPAPAPALPGPAPQEMPPPTPPPAGPTSGTPPPAGGPASVAPPTSADHNLNAVNMGIDSAATAIGNAAATAASIGAGGMGGGAAGALIAGGVQQAGKIVKGLVNVASSALVGSVPGSFGTTPEAYGRTLRPAQNVPQTAIPRAGSTYNVSAVQIPQAMQELRLHEALDQQAQFAAQPRI